MTPWALGVTSCQCQFEYCTLASKNTPVTQDEASPTEDTTLFGGCPAKSVHAASDPLPLGLDGYLMVYGMVARLSVFPERKLPRSPSPACTSFVTSCDKYLINSLNISVALRAIIADQTNACSCIHAHGSDS